MPLTVTFVNRMIQYVFQESNPVATLPPFIVFAPVIGRSYIKCDRAEPEHGICSSYFYSMPTCALSSPLIGPVKSGVLTLALYDPLYGVLIQGKRWSTECRAHLRLIATLFKRCFWPGICPSLAQMHVHRIESFMLPCQSTVGLSCLMPFSLAEACNDFAWPSR